MSSTFPGVNRRRALAGGGLLALLALTAPACGSAPAPPATDDLESQQRLARRDSELATAAGAALTGLVPPAIAPALTQVAAERAEHARVLAAEIARVAGTSESTSAEAPAPASTEPAAPAPLVADVVNALRDAATSAAKLATESSGYRAGLLSSIAAACTAAHTVALAPEP